MVPWNANRGIPYPLKAAKCPGSFLTSLMLIFKMIPESRKYCMTLKSEERADLGEEQYLFLTNKMFFSSFSSYSHSLPEADPHPTVSCDVFYQTKA